VVFVIGACILTMAAAHPGVPGKPRVQLETSKGVIVVELEAQKAPTTVANFLSYVRSGFYDGTVFHRVIPNFMIQGGGMGADFARKATGPPIPNEAANGLKNLRGTVAMARTAEVDSATSQFFINLRDNPHLDHRGPTPQEFGYCVFGRVVQGMEVVDAIAAIPTGPRGPFRSDVPVETVTILKAVVLAP